MTAPARLAALSLFMVACALPLPAAEDAPITAEERNAGHRARVLLAKPRPGADVAAVEADEGLRLVRAHARFGGLRTLETDGTEDIKAVIARLKDSGVYVYVEPDYLRFKHVLPDDARFAADQWALNNTGQSGGTAGADIKAAAAWDIQREAPDVIVGVIDSGVRFIHEDIAGNLWRNASEFGGVPAADDDANGYADDLHGINATVAKTSLLSGDPSDEDGHGTHVAGIIGAISNNGLGISGVAWKTQILPLKMLGRNGGSVSAIVACVDYAIAKGAKIVNCSYGSLSFSQAEYEAFKRGRDAGIIFVASAGNDSQEIMELPEYPAAYPLDNIVAVASTTRQDKLASYSTYGSGLVDLAAPGSSILSLGISVNAPYVSHSGTSMAAPHVSGALALLRQKFPSENYRAIINRLLGSVDQLPALEHRVHTNGRLNLLRALTSADARPFNDDFARRAAIIGDLNLVRGSNQFATTEAAEPKHGAASLWWTWTAPANGGKARLSTLGSEYDTVVTVYTGTALGTLTPIASNDDADTSTTTSSLTFNVTPGATYSIAVTSKSATSTGLLLLSLVSIPLNDAFATAHALSGPSVTINANNAGATAEPGEPKALTSRGNPVGQGQTLWFKWVAPATRRFQISVTDDAIDPVLSVWTGTALGNLVNVGSNDDASAALFRFDSMVDFAATAGVTYYLCVDTSFGSGGRFALSIADADWQYLTNWANYAAPAITASGSIAVLDGFGYTHLVSPAGTRSWRYTAAGFSYGGATAIAPDGTVYFGDDLGDVHAVNPNGSKKWTFSTTGFIWTAPALGADGTIYVKSDDEFLYALNPDGSQKWRFAIPGDTYSSPVIGADGTIYIASGGDSHVYALNPDGTQKWRANLGATIYATPAIGADGTLYVGNYDGRFFALRADGTERWRFDTNSPLSGSAVIDARGYVYFGSYDKKLYALDAATGAKRWDYTTGDTIRATTPLIADDGAIYIGSDDGFVHAVNPDGTRRRTYATGGPILAAPALSAGRLYVASTDAKLYAFEIGANLARTPWPMAGHNLRRTARAAELPGIPTITTQPVAASVAAGRSVSFNVGATVAGGGTLAYQWRLNNVALPGATAATLTLASAQTSDVGSYSVVVSGPGGSVVSQAVNLAVAAGDTSAARLINLAVRTTAGSGDRVLFVGFVVGGRNTSGNKPLLIRGVGPTLGAFGVPGVLADPKLQLFAGTTLLVENDDWAGDTQVATIAPQVGAFAFAGTTSKDAALVSTRPAGSFTAQLSGVGAEPGIALAEIYDATPAAAFTASTPRLINVSARTNVGTGGDVLIAGFVIGGTGQKTILVRAIGPTLGVFGVPGVLADPKLDLFASGSSAAISTNDNWGAAANAAQVTTAAAAVGAFALALESKDAVLLVTLPPGSYTAQVSGVNNTTGAALVEVYEVP